GDNAADDENERTDHQRHHAEDHGEGLRGGGDPGELPTRVGVERASGEKVERDDRRRDDDHRPPGEVFLDRNQDPLENGNTQGDLQAALGKPPADPASRRPASLLTHARNLPRWGHAPYS